MINTVCPSVPHTYRSICVYYDCNSSLFFFCCMTMEICYLFGLPSLYILRTGRYCQRWDCHPNVAAELLCASSLVSSRRLGFTQLFITTLAAEDFALNSTVLWALGTASSPIGVELWTWTHLTRFTHVYGGWTLSCLLCIKPGLEADSDEVKMWSQTPLMVGNPKAHCHRNEGLPWCFSIVA
jgi:hypothetical protein